MKKLKDTKLNESIVQSLSVSDSGAKSMPDANGNINIATVIYGNTMKITAATGAQTVKAYVDAQVGSIETALAGV